jgi:hypothetical protein
LGVEGSTRESFTCWVEWCSYVEAVSFGAAYDDIVAVGLGDSDCGHTPGDERSRAGREASTGFVQGRVGFTKESQD